MEDHVFSGNKKKKCLKSTNKKVEKRSAIYKMNSWKIASSTAERLNFFQNNEEDVTFLVGMEGKEEPKLFKSFKFILIDISPVFERMLNGNFKEATLAEPVKIIDIYANDFETFLHFIYGEKPYVSNWKKLYDIAKKYMADDVVKSICQELKNMEKTPLEALQLFEITYCENESLETPETSMNESTTATSALVQAFRTQCSYMFSLNPDAFLMLLDNVKSHVTVTSLFQTVNTYCSHERNFISLSHKSHLIKVFLSQIDFSKMTVVQFLDYVEPSDILDVNKKYKILVDLNRKEFDKCSEECSHECPSYRGY